MLALGGRDSLVDWSFFFQAEDGIRDLVRSRGLGDVYKRQVTDGEHDVMLFSDAGKAVRFSENDVRSMGRTARGCLLYTSDAADDLLCVDLGGRRIIKKKKRIRY